MRVLLISANTEKINMPILPLGLACVAAATRLAGHQVAFVDLMPEEYTYGVLEEAAENFKPEVVGVSVRNIDDQNMAAPQFLLEQVREVINKCRSLTDAPIVLGGAGYSIYPQEALAYLGADMGIQGEGEIAFPILVEKLQRGQDVNGTPGLYLPGGVLQTKRRYCKDLDALPSPQDHLWSASSSYLEDQDFWLPLQTRRGCPLNCSYCSTPTIEGKIIRKRSPERVVEEISELVATGFKRFHFVDNTFNLPYSYAADLCGRLAAAELDIAWRGIVYPWKVDEELVKWMARAGCKEVALGFESGSERILRAMNKRFTLDDVRTISGILGAYGIYRLGFLLLGHPGETRRTAEESLVFADSLNLELIKVTCGIRIYPYTSLARAALAEGMLAADDDLLQPRFYLVKGLEQWLPETVRTWMDERPHWVS
ncbi:MAG: radical SAM protein [Deltaproteobacteria bacterium]|nr:radical SAM protein [Deltaproteobacteria bacterium]MBW2070286.1 radical SAM protein [Deltaproteobacteria bacterium]